MAGWCSPVSPTVAAHADGRGRPSAAVLLRIISLALRMPSYKASGKRNMPLTHTDSHHARRTNRLYEGWRDAERPRYRPWRVAWMMRNIATAMRMPANTASVILIQLYG